MKNKPLYLLVGVFIGVAVSLAGVSLYKAMTVSEVTYVDVPKLFNSFKLKKELSSKLEVIVSKRKEITDSMEVEIQMLASHLNRYSKDEKALKQYAKLKDNYRINQQRFVELNTRDAEKFDEQIYTQINQFITDYGKENNYRFILGANGNGAMLYAHTGNDITTEVIEYVNRKYLGDE